MSKKMRTVVNFSIAIGILAIFAVLGALFDLQISAAVYNPNALYGNFFEKLGEFPFYFSLAIGATIFFYNDFFINRKRLFHLFKAIFFVAAFAGWFLIMTWITSNFVNRPGLDKADYLQYVWVYQVVVAFVVNTVTLLLMKNANRDTMKKIVLVWSGYYPCFCFFKLYNQNNKVHLGQSAI